MGAEWRSSTWGNEISLEYGKALRGYDVTHGKYRVFGSNGPVGWTAQPLAHGPGVILGRKGAYRGVEYSPNPFFVIDTAYYVVPKTDLDMRWLYYAIKHYKLGEIDDGSPIPSTTRAAVYFQDLEVPPPNEQRAIAHILGTLDDKIELNRRMNETLEAMARALFKSWFVDFDPVRAKAERRDPGLPKPLADLFPDSFEDSELGEIPKGWGVGTLGDVLCQRVERCAPSAETTARPYVPIDCISPKSLFLSESKPGEEAQSSLTTFYKGDLLFGAMRPYFHKVCIPPFDGTTRTTAFVLYPRQADDFSFATLLLHHPDTIDFATRHSTGSTIPYAVWTGSLEDMPVVVPPPDVRKAFNSVVQPTLARIPEPYFENRTLAALRDSLLPKLISGELRLSNVSRMTPA